MPKKPRVIYELRVELEDVEPPVWRSFRIPADATLRDLHGVLQLVMGWTGSHLHVFQHNGDRYAEPGPDFEMDGADIDTEDVTVGDLLTRPGDDLVYDYDFGDGWTHLVSLTAIHRDSGPEVWCLDGQRACPPEDCGGPMGYARLLGILAKPRHREHRDMLAWLEPEYPGGFRPEAFDPASPNARFATGGMAGVRAMLDAPDDDMDALDDEDEANEPPAGNIIQFPGRP